jgi:hypothetical protein
MMTASRPGRDICPSQDLDKLRNIRDALFDVQLRLAMISPMLKQLGKSAPEIRECSTVLKMASP